MAGLVLIAAGGLAREALNAVRATGFHDDVLLLDDDQSTWGHWLVDTQIVGGIDLVTEYPDHQVVVCAGRGEVRNRLVERLEALGVKPDRFHSIVHPLVDVPLDCQVGDGSILLESVVLTAGVLIGEHVVVMPNVTLTHDNVVDDFATIAAGVSLGGGVQIGAAAYLGMNSCVREGVRIGAGSTLGMGSVLLQDLPPGETWVGAPATPLRVRGGAR